MVFASQGRIYWHGFIDHLAARKSTESFFFAGMTSTSSHDEQESNSLAEKRRPLRKGLPFSFRIWPPWLPESSCDSRMLK
jgi:hypothetical protein